MPIGMTIWEPRSPGGASQRNHPSSRPWNPWAMRAAREQRSEPGLGRFNSLHEVPDSLAPARRPGLGFRNDGWVRPIRLRQAGRPTSGRALCGVAQPAPRPQPRSLPECRFPGRRRPPRASAGRGGRGVAKRAAPRSTATPGAVPAISPKREIVTASAASPKGAMHNCGAIGRARRFLAGPASLHSASAEVADELRLHVDLQALDASSIA